jgi:hypothetical protein
MDESDGPRLKLQSDSGCVISRFYARIVNGSCISDLRSCLMLENSQMLLGYSDYRSGTSRLMKRCLATPLFNLFTVYSIDMRFGLKEEFNFWFL